MTAILTCGTDWASDPVAPPDGAAWDLLVVGGGTAGLVAAKTAARFGASVLLAERDRTGGDCLWTGCVPSKALLAAAEARHVALDAGGRFPGISASADAVDMPALIAGKRALVEGMRSEEYVDLIADYGWHVRQGTASFAGTPEESLRWRSPPPLGCGNR